MSPSTTLSFLTSALLITLASSVSIPFPFPDHGNHNHNHQPAPPPPPPVITSSASASPVGNNYGKPISNPISAQPSYGYSFISQPQPQQQQANTVPIIRSEYNAPTDPLSPWSYSFETGDGVRQSVEGSVRTIGDGGEPFVVMRGSYSYTGPDGNEYVVDWFADETGFHPSAPHLPVAPEIPHPAQAAAVAEQIKRAAEEDKNVDLDVGGGGDNFIEDLPSYISAF